MIGKNLSALLAAATLGFSAPAWAINKCTALDGKVSYQEAPCSSTQGAAELKVQAGPATTDQEARFNNSIAVGKIMVGMTAAHVRRAWGEPTKINVTLGASGRTEQWVYRGRNFRDDYVYVDNGVVRSVQGSE